MERRFAVHARAHRKALSGLLAAAVLLTGAPLASAAPKTPEAKAAFDRGVAAYTANDYAGASEALGQSYALEPDVETLFAWAQTERKLEHCDKASELYGKLLAYDLPEENKGAIRAKLEECKAIIAAQKPVEPAPTPVTEPVVPAPQPPPEEPGPSSTTRAWWKDPVGGALVGVGVVGLGVGGYLLISARSLDADKDNATSYGEFKRLEDKASSRGTLGVIAAAGGGALLVAGIVWYATRGGGDERPTQVTGWITSDGGGVAAAGRF
jgi:tetratricopeptide (TPR) repeat protein